MLENSEQFDQMIFMMNTMLNEKQKRVLLGCAAEVYGRGGITRICDITGMAPITIRKGIEEVKEYDQIDQTRIRSKGAGRKTTEDQYPELEENIQKIIEGSTYGNPAKVLLYTTLSLRKIQQILLDDYQIDISHVKIGQIIEKIGYSKQQNQKNLQIGEPHPDRNGQFEYINAKASEFIDAGDPVISVDTKKKELIGNFKNAGAEYRKEKDPRQVLDHDFPIPELGKVAPYGIYVLNDNTGFINLGTDHDTAEFASESILRWWESIGKNTFPKAKRIYINADSGGSNGARVKLWKYELQQFANHTGLEVHVSHFPSGTSKWNKIEHKLFCYISKNWQGKPLIDIETVISLISSTTTKKGLKVTCKVDTNKYELQRKVSEEEMNSINMQECDQYGWWNYIIRPINK